MNTNFKFMSFFLMIMSIFFTRNTVYSQVKLSIDSLSISYVVDSTEIYFIGDSLVVNSKKDVVDLYDESLGQGPYICGYITVSNQTKEAFFLQRSDILNNSHYQFFINNKVYNIDILDLSHVYDYPVTIPSGEKYTIMAGTWLFLGTDIDKRKGSEYNKEVIEALPTLQFVLKYNGKTYKSCGIKKVIYVNRDDE